MLKFRHSSRFLKLFSHLKPFLKPTSTVLVRRGVWTDAGSFSRFSNTLPTTYHRDGIVIRVTVSNGGTEQSSCRLDMATIDPPPSYDVAVIYSGHRLNTASDYSAVHSQVCTDVLVFWNNRFYFATACHATHGIAKAFLSVS